MMWIIQAVNVLLESLDIKPIPTKKPDSKRSEKR